MRILVLLGGLLIPSVLGKECNYDLEVGTTAINISSGLDPKCTWTATAFSDYRLKLTCDVHLPGGINLGLGGCLLNFLSISASGDPDLTDGIKYCGNETFTILSDLNMISIKLTSSLLPNNLLGISFSCSLQAVFEPCSCGRRNKGNGTGNETDVQVNEFPAIAYIGPSKQEKPEVYCGATIVSNWRAITAQSCVMKYFSEDLSLIVGDYDISSTTDSPYTAIYDIDDTYCYIGCHHMPEVGHVDLAFVMTKNEIQMNPGVGVICLPYNYKDEDITNKHVLLLGWTNASTGAIDRNVQQKEIVIPISIDFCELTYPNSSLIYNMCTDPDPRRFSNCWIYGGNSVINEDAGNKRIYIVGVVSYDLDCTQNIPFINTRPGPLLEWISPYTPESSYCETLK